MSEVPPCASLYTLRSAAGVCIYMQILSCRCLDSRARITLLIGLTPDTVELMPRGGHVLQGYLAHKKQPPPPRTAIGP